MCSGDSQQIRKHGISYSWKKVYHLSKRTNNLSRYKSVFSKDYSKEFVWATEAGKCNASPSKTLRFFKGKLPSLLPYLLPQLKLLANFVLSKPRSAAPDGDGKILVLKDIFKKNKSMVPVPRALEIWGGWGFGVCCFCLVFYGYTSQTQFR